MRSDAYEIARGIFFGYLAIQIFEFGFWVVKVLAQTYIANVVVG